MLWLILLTLLVTGPADRVFASGQTNLKVLVLPLECLFETVDDGSNTIVYLTPEQCGVLIPAGGETPAIQPAFGPGNNRTGGLPPVQNNPGAADGEVPSDSSSPDSSAPPESETTTNPVWPTAIGLLIPAAAVIAYIFYARSKPGKNP